MSYKIQVHIELLLYTNLNYPVKATVTVLRHQGHHSRDKKEKTGKMVSTVGSLRCYFIFQVTF